MKGKTLKRYEMTCQHCGKTFLVTRHFSLRRKYCSRECSLAVNAVKNLGNWTKPEKITERNKDPEFRKAVSAGLKSYFHKHPRKYEQWYIDRYGIDYKVAKAKHSHEWKNISRYLRDHYPCRITGSTDNLVVHHIIPYSVSRDNSLKNLIVLSRSVHKRIEEDMIRVKNIVGDWQIARLLLRLRLEDKGEALNYEMAH